ncbi:A-type ATP synthase subunit I [Halodesulfurarchaeum formicicum]|uniref:A-type ATP synthase subunit I n=1 Tax=Halodesulfurarchaeum formicicum TaxID=1873524 RepID=A0A1D8S6I9_9EURY|nr:V-type ATP synthase subunit I [Halodesulfurarchaeum formicicum]AOW80976.1 A-type ATP synthase subunit I [Halodesulfurarchaeum formicicum]
MLRPERMSKVSVAGSTQVIEPVIEAIHDLELVHLSEYEGQIEGFETGAPLSGAESAADQLVTVRSLQSMLDIEGAAVDQKRILDRETVPDRLESIRETVTDLDDRRSEIRSELTRVRDEMDSVDPFVDLGIDFDLLRGYENLSVMVGTGDREAVEDTLADAEEIEAFEVFAGTDVLAVFAYPSEPSLEDALVGVEFTEYEIPDGEGEPEAYLEQLEARKAELEADLESVEADLDAAREDHAEFLLAVEEALSIDVQKREAPLRFATTDHAFVAEGWLPADEFETFETAVSEAASGRVAVDQMEVAEHGEYVPTHEDHEADGEEPTAESPAEDVAADGGNVELESGDSPPVVLDNPAFAKPFELLVKAINRPTYWELDPTIPILLTFPIMFGFMIGDLGYGALYAGIGYLIVSRVDSDGLRSLGGIAVWAGVFTMLFGVLYGEIFGLHGLGDVVWGGHPPLHKGLQPNFLAYAQAWLFLSLFVGLFHLTAGYVFGFVNLLGHGLKDAFLEKGSWVVLMGGMWLWIFSTHAAGAKPDLLYTVFNRAGATIPSGTTLTADQVAFGLGFGGFPETVGLVGLALAGIGLTLLLLGEGGIGALESLNVLVNVLSYTRIAAVLLAKAGMAFVVNLLFFGAYQDPEGLFHFLVIGGHAHAPEGASVLFEGLVNMGPIGWLGGLLVLFVGHLLVLALGITSAGLQAVRLEYVEFFGKFYEGGGANYNPFGYTRRYTTTD